MKEGHRICVMAAGYDERIRCITTLWVVFFLCLLVVGAALSIGTSELVTSTAMIILISFRYSRHLMPGAANTTVEVQDRHESHDLLSDAEVAGMVNSVTAGEMQSLESLVVDIQARSSTIVEDRHKSHYPLSGVEVAAAGTVNSTIPDEIKSPEQNVDIQGGPSSPRQLARNGGNHLPIDSRTITRRLPFLDNVKIFLTASVVTHHVSCAFGGCGEASWFLILEDEGAEIFNAFAKGLVLLNQAYFMPLFFFISAYFVPTSYERKGPKAFRANKARRLYLPAMVVTFTLVPVCIIISEYIKGKQLFYGPAAAHTWFLFWLLLLYWIYDSFERVPVPPALTTSVCDGPGATETPANEQELQQFPSTRRRLAYASLICGLLMLVVIIGSKPALALMPITVGSFTCDLFMFYCGVLAKRNKWLDYNNNNEEENSDDNTNSTTSSARLLGLSSKMDISPAILRVMVLVEAAAMIALFLVLGLDDDNPGFAILALIVAGAFCVDMGLAVLQLFQESAHLQRENRFSRFLSKAAYTAYLIHPLVVVAVTAVYIRSYNFIVGNEGDEIRFDPDESVGTGGGDYYFVGWVLVNLASHVILWPLSWCISQAPILRDIL